MIRTRDFLLFVTIIVFLVVGIGATLIYQGWQQRAPATVIGFFSTQESIWEATSPEHQSERDATIARLREKIAAGEGVTAGIPDLDSTPEPAPVTNVLLSGERTLVQCPQFSTDAALIVTWPKTNVTVRAVEGVRLVAHISSTIASTSKPELSERPLYHLSLVQLRNSFDTCVSGEVIGVTPQGTLLKNSDASQYHSVAENTLIGYALDGLPIYGVTGATDTLDACGGASSLSGYRYHIRTDENFIIGCFAGTPAPFIGN